VATDPLGGFLALREVTPRRIVGLISGTSADGVDAALVEVEGAGADLQVRLLEFASRPYSPPLRARVVAAGEASAPALLDLHYELGEVFAEAAGALIEVARRRGLAVHLIGSHGQTARHHPRATGAHGQAATLQIAEPAVIAERTGLPVVADFRPADVAAGGEGAPLVPLVDWLLFRLAARTRACLNIGGIANATVLAGEAAGVRAFDLGPGNMPLDLVVHAWTGGAETFDRDGARAARRSGPTSWRRSSEPTPGAKRTCCGRSHGSLPRGSATGFAGGRGSRWTRCWSRGAVRGTGR
jgi:anhydro-N-acetylmuramic acid kinase